MNNLLPNHQSFEYQRGYDDGLRAARLSYGSKEIIASIKNCSDFDLLEDYSNIAMQQYIDCRRRINEKS